MSTVKSAVQATTAQFRFYGELNDFLSPDRKRTRFKHTVKGRPSIKDTIEALGVPHPELSDVFINGQPADFTCQLQEGDNVRAYPQHYAPRSKKRKRLRPTFRGRPRFVLDSHLGKLARHLRLLGFDTIYQKIFPDSEIVDIGVLERRIILTRDIGLLKNRRIIYGSWLRSADPQKQLREVLKKFRLAPVIKPLTLCLECNGRIRRVAKKRISHQLPEQTKLFYHRFFLCQSCKKIYWRGSHYDRLRKIIRKSGFRGRLPGD